MEEKVLAQERVQVGTEVYTLSLVRSLSTNEQKETTVWYDFQIEFPLPSSASMGRASSNREAVTRSMQHFKTWLLNQTNAPTKNQVEQWFIDN